MRKEVQQGWGLKGTKHVAPGRDRTESWPVPEGPGATEMVPTGLSCPGALATYVSALGLPQ